MPIGRKQEPAPLPETVFNIDSMLTANGEALAKLNATPAAPGTHGDREKQRQRLRARQDALLERRLKLTDAAAIRGLDPEKNR